MKGIPDDAECLDILYDAGCSRRVIIHCCTVRAVAEEMLNGIETVDRRLVLAGSLLHDIGRSADNGIMHAYLGSMIVRDLDLPEKIEDIVRKHTGAGLDDIDVEEMRLPPGDYMPKTREEKIVAHADNLVSDDRVVTHRQAVEKLRNKGAFRGADRIEALHLELSELYGKDLDVIPKIIGEYPKLMLSPDKI